MKNPFVFGYTASYMDPCTRYCILGDGARWYSPALMRFTSGDDWSPFGVGGIHPYAYCAGDPINFSDPSGHAPWSWLGKMVRRVSRLSGGSRSIRDDEAPLIATDRAEHEADADEEQRRGADEQAAHAWANRMAHVPEQAAIAAVAANLYEAVARTESERRLELVSNSARARMTELADSGLSRPRSHSLYGRPFDSELEGRGRHTLWHEQFEFLIRRTRGANASWMSEEDRLAMPARIRSDMADTLMRMSDQPPRPSAPSAQMRLDTSLPY